MAFKPYCEECASWHDADAPHVMRKQNYRPNLYVDEHKIQRAVCINVDKYGVPGLVYWHVPNGGARDGREAKRLQEAGVKPGIPDLHFLHAGRFYVLELKAEWGRLSAAQSDMLRRLLAAGAYVGVANTLHDALACLSDWGLIRDCPLVDNRHKMSIVDNR